MSDPQVNGPETPVGDPVDDRPVVDDVVGSANAGLADAEAARDGVPRDQSASDEPLFSDGTAPDSRTADGPAAAASSSSDDRSQADQAYAAAEPAEYNEPAASAEERYTPPAADTAAQTTAYNTAASDDDVPWYDRPDAASDVAAASAVSAGAASTGAASASTASTASSGAAAPREAAYAPIPPAAMQPIFVQAPEAPRPRGNRGAAGAIGLLAAVLFAVLYLAAWLGFGLINGDITVDTIGESALNALTTWTLWVPTVVFFLAFWLLGGIINRGRWGHWVVFGLFVGVASYAGHILGELFQAPFWMLTAREGATAVEQELLAPLAIAAFVIGRELTIWFGAWVSARGKRVTELNAESQREYERTLEAGPQLVQQ